MREAEDRRSKEEEEARARSAKRTYVGGPGMSSSMTVNRPKKNAVRRIGL